MDVLANSVTVGTRGSALARWQADWVCAALRQAWPVVELRLKTFTTAGDRLLDQPLPEIGGKGVFTAELENALRSGEIDLAVHSLKDLPIADTPGLSLGAVAIREDARDVLISAVGRGLAALPPRARVGTSSPRRSSQLLAARPDLTVLPLRGNVDTRIRKALAGEYDAIVLAAAGVLRMGLHVHITEYLPLEVMLPAPGQGALAMQCRAGATAMQSLLRPLDDSATRLAVTAERAFLSALGGGCSAPIAAYAACTPESIIALIGLVTARDGQRLVRVSGTGSNADALGAELAQQALAQGAEHLLA